MCALLGYTAHIRKTKKFPKAQCSLPLACLISSAGAVISIGHFRTHFRFSVKNVRCDTPHWSYMGTLPTGWANQNSLTAISSKAELHGWPSVCINLWYIKFLLAMYPTACKSNKQFAISPCPWFEASAEHKINTYVLVYSNRQCVALMGKPVHAMGRIKLLAGSLQALLWSKSSWPTLGL